ncbi:MAG: autotransporter-associated beta strand repeat-containing protein [Candidatus Didemnitutus sp.]|nr:autotransporter-associated beta strand repeat-containing protein [Candidatus Didemnitutus sp.]
MNTPQSGTSRRASKLLLLGTALLALPVAAFAQSLNWIGNSTGSWQTASNWTENTTPAGVNAPYDIIIAPTGFPANGNLVATILAGGNYTIRSLTVNNANGILGNVSNSTGLRIASASNNTTVIHRTTTFGTAGITIINVTNNIGVSFNAATSSGNNSTITMNLGYSGFGTIHTDATSSFTVNVANSTIVGTGGIIKTGAGTLRLSGNHTYAGGAELVEGITVVQSSGSTSSGTIVSSPFGTGSVKLSGGSMVSSSDTGRTIYGSVQLNGTVAITSNTTGQDGPFTISNTATGAATTLLTNSTLNIATTANWNQAISGGFGLTKTGAGKLLLNAANTYSGSTTVSAGTLELGPTGSLAGSLTVASGATLSGTGTIGGAATISGIHSPGFSPGIQTFSGDLTYNNGATINWELTDNTSTQGDPTPVYDQIFVGSTLNFAGATSLTPIFNAAGSATDWNAAFWSTNQTWKIYDAVSVLNFGNLTLAGSNYADSLGVLLNTARPAASFGLSEVSGDVYLNYSIPEPSTYAALFGLITLGFVVWRRRQAALVK